MAAYIGTRPAARNHQLPKPHFEALCAGLGDAEAIHELWATQRSRRLLLINAVVEAAHEIPGALGPLPPAADAWEVLTRAEDAAPEAFTDILLHPQVGNWAAYVLRRDRGGADSDAPLWIDIGMIHALALTAAAHVGHAWRTKVPARRGRVMLPRLGMATFPASDTEPWSYADAETDHGRIRLTLGDCTLVVPTSDEAQNRPGRLPDRAHGASWWPLRRLRVSGELGPDLLVFLDDIDPYRDLADPVPPARLGDAEFAAWSDLLARAWDLLCRDHRPSAESISEGVVSLVPLARGDGSETRSASTGEAFGSVLISPPFDEVTLAVSLVHEFQHIKLGGLIHLGPLAIDDDRQCYYAPWRDDPRPLSGLLQGAYAFTGIMAFWRRHRARQSGRELLLADFEYAYARLQVDDALCTLDDSPGLTRWGTQVVQSLTRQIRPWLAEPLLPQATKAAELSAAWHRAGWRIRHLQPAPADVEALATAWIDNTPEDETTQLHAHEATVVPHPQLRFARGMAALIRQQLDVPKLPDEAARLSSLNLTEADAALVRGDTRVAHAGYTARIKADPDDFDAWIGLGLSADADERGESPEHGSHERRALLDLPDLVRAAYLHLIGAGHAPDPAQLAARAGRAAAAPTGRLTRATSCPE